MRAPSCRSPVTCRRLRDICTREGTLLIFDEVMTGFRVALGGAQALYGITPDMTTLGKIIGGGLPVGAFGGRAENHEPARAAGPRLPGRHAERQSALAMAAGHRSPAAASAGRRSVLRWRSRKPPVASHEGVAGAAQQAGIPIYTARVGSMFTWFFQARSGAQLRRCRKERHRTSSGRFHRGMLEHVVCGCRPHSMRRRGLYQACMVMWRLRQRSPRLVRCSRSCRIVMLWRGVPCEIVITEEFQAWYEVSLTAAGADQHGKDCGIAGGTWSRFAVPLFVGNQRIAAWQHART